MNRSRIKFGLVATSLCCMAWGVLAYAQKPNLQSQSAESGGAPADSNLPMTTAIVDSSPAEGSPSSFSVTINNSDAESHKQSGQHVVIFSKGRVFDFSLLPPYHVTVIEPASQRIVLMSREQQVRCTVSTKHLMEETVRVKSKVDDEDLRARLGIDAKVDSDEDGTHEVKFGMFHYNTTTQTTPTREVAVAFAQFADWACRLNIIRKLGPPPFGRMQLNAKLASLQCLPEKMTLRYGNETQQQTFLSEYEFSPKLTPADQDRIADVTEMLANYREIPLKAFR